MVDSLEKRKTKRTTTTNQPRYILNTIDSTSPSSSDKGSPALKRHPKNEVQASRATSASDIVKVTHNKSSNSKTHEMTRKVDHLTPLPSIEGGDDNLTVRSIQDYIDQKKEDSIERLMAFVEEFIDSRLSLSAHDHGIRSRNCDKSGGKPAGGDSSGSGSGSKKMTGKKRLLRSESEENLSSNEDGDGGKNRDKKRSKVSDPASRRFACPFFKHDPAKYKDKSACTGPGFLTIARLKEHVFRRHTRPEYSCARCCEPFKDQESLEEHQRAEEMCDRRARPLGDGISRVQRDKIKKKTIPGKTEEDKWRAIYQIIFPDSRVIPSPYFDYDQCEPRNNGADDRDRFFQRAFLPRVRRALDQRYDTFENETKEGLLYILKDVFNECQKLEAAPAQFAELGPFQELTSLDDFPGDTGVDIDQFLAEPYAPTLPGLDPSFDFLGVGCLPANGSWDSTYGTASPSSFKE